MPASLFSKPTLTLFYPFIILLLSVLTLIGWHWNLEDLRQMLPGSVSMNPLTAILFICSAIVITSDYVYKTQKVFSRILTAIVLLIGLLKLLHYCQVMTFDLDGAIFSTAIENETAGSFKNQIAPNTALNFFLIGLALLTYRNIRWPKYLPECCSLVVLFTAFLSIIGYLYNANELYGIAKYIPMALPTAICFLFLSIALILNRKKSLVLRILTGTYHGSRMARYLLPIGIFLPIILGLARVYSHNAGIITSNFGTAVFAAVNIIIFLFFILRAAIFINRSEEKLMTEIRQRKLAEEELRKIERQVLIRQSTISGQEKERKQIGMELHDNINQILASSSLYLDLIKSQPASQELLISKSKQGITDAIQEIRKLTKAIVPPDINTESIINSIKDFAYLIHESSGLNIDLSLPPEIINSLEENERLAIYRIIQEQLNNIVKHADATHSNITLKKQQSRAILQIADDGCGFDIQKKHPGIGLSNIQNRVEMLRGSFFIKSAPGAGCQLTIELPCS